MNIYEPAEDSRMLAEAVNRHAFGKVIDIGTGSGIQAAAAIKSKKVTKITATDINKNCKKNVKNISSRIKFICSDLFENIPKQKFDMSETQSVSESQKPSVSDDARKLKLPTHAQNRRGGFDTIIFNPPYLPQDKGIKDATIYGGKKGYEIIERFLSNCSSYLSKKGIILLVFSSLSKKNRIDELIEDNCLKKEELERKELPFVEMLYVYKIRKSPLLLNLEQKRIFNIKKFAEGHRGIIYAGKLGSRKVAIKARRKDSAAKGNIANEAKWLKILNRHNIGPRLISSGRDYFIYEFVEGRFIMDFINSCSSKRMVAAVIKNVFQQCRMLDKLKVNKGEMLRPYKHIIIDKKPVMVDFERCKKTRKPKNITQFCQFLVSGNVRGLLKAKGIAINKEAILSAAKSYKKAQNTANFNKISAMIK